MIWFRSGSGLFTVPRVKAKHGGAANTVFMLHISATNSQNTEDLPQLSSLKQRLKTSVCYCNFINAVAPFLFLYCVRLTYFLLVCVLFILTFNVFYVLCKTLMPFLQCGMFSKI